MNTQEKAQHQKDCLYKNGSPIDIGCSCKHTPTPWKLESGNLWENLCSCVARVGGVAGDLGIGIMAPKSPNSYSEKENKANAAFIVRAVNSHEALIEATKNLIKTLESFDGIDDYITMPNGMTIGQVKEVIAQAEARP